MIKTFQPAESLSETQIRRGLRWLFLEGASSLGFNSIMSSGFMAAYALLLGANTFQIGLLAASPFLFQPLQLLFVPLTEKLRLRKLMSFAAWTIVMILWIPIALLPFTGLGTGQAVGTLLIISCVQGVLRSLLAVNWQSWLRDLIPLPIMGDTFARRLRYGTQAAIVFSLATSLFIEYWGSIQPPSREVYGYALMLLGGLVLVGFLSPICMLRLPELRMQRPTEQAEGQARGLSGLTKPLRDPGYRTFMSFLFTRAFYLSLVTPFFTVFMLQKMEFSLSLVIFFSILSMIANAWVLPVWGTYVDRFGAKPVMMACSSLIVVLVLPMWALVSSVDRGTQTSEWLVYFLIGACMISMGVATAGANIAMSVLGMKKAPPVNQSSYLAASSIATSAGAGLGPLVGGWLIDLLLRRQLTIFVEWTGPEASLGFAGLLLGGYEFMFLLACLLGLVASNLLTHIQEDDEKSRTAVVDELYVSSADAVRAINSVPGLRFVIEPPMRFVRQIPGVDTALGMTLNQLSSTIRATVATSQTGTESVRHIAPAVSDYLSRTLKGKKSLEAHAEDIAYHAARGATHAAWDLDVESSQLIQVCMQSIAQELGSRMDTKGGTRRTLRGIVRGVMRGAYEVRQDLKDTAIVVYRAGMKVALEVGLTESQADRVVVSAMRYTSRRIGRRAARDIRAILTERKESPKPDPSMAQDDQGVTAPDPNV